MIGDLVVDAGLLDTGEISTLVLKSPYYIPATTRSLRLNLAATRSSTLAWDELYLSVNPNGAGWSANLITDNPSAENSPITTWTFGTGSWTRAQYSTGYFKMPPGQTTSNYVAYCNNSNISCYMDIDVSSYATDIDNGVCLVWYQGWFGSWNTGDVWTTVNCEFRVSAGGTVVATKSLLKWANWCPSNGNVGMLDILSMGRHEDAPFLKQVYYQGDQRYYHSEDDLGVQSFT